MQGIFVLHNLECFPLILDREEGGERRKGEIESSGDGSVDRKWKRGGERGRNTLILYEDRMNHLGIHAMPTCIIPVHVCMRRSGWMRWVEGLGQDGSNIVGGVFGKLRDEMLCLLDGLRRSSGGKWWVFVNTKQKYMYLQQMRSLYRGLVDTLNHGVNPQIRTPWKRTPWQTGHTWMSQTTSLCTLHLLKSH